MTLKNLAVEKDGSVAVVTINRPDALNAINIETMTEIGQAMLELGGDADVRVIIVTGAGKAFAAGADISELQTRGGMEARDISQHGQRTFSIVENLSKPVIAAVNGYALGGGLELAMACDVRIASTRAKMGQPEVTLGLVPGFAGTQRLPRLVGFGRAKQMLLTGGPIDAETALSWGLVNKVVEPDALLDAAKEMAVRIAGNGPAAVGLVKACVNKGTSTDVDAGGTHESDAFGLCFASGEAKEGITAFFEKRPANWIEKQPE
ncbi:enoyl-CoA hydratase/isomerase family protein [bacterium]|nr:enoyl-CoA hydratase/isomerase family protein [bacterium]